MKLQCDGGPMDGAIYAISKDHPSTNRKPDGLWFDATDEHGRNIQHQYRDAGNLTEDADGVIVQYAYDGAVVETGIEFETE
jgi:hypothetical protein